MSTLGLKTIETGLGDIYYKADNLDLQFLMEALAERIKKDGPKSVLRLIEYDLISS